MKMNKTVTRAIYYKYLLISSSGLRPTSVNKSYVSSANTSKFSIGNTVSQYTAVTKGSIDLTVSVIKDIFDALSLHVDRLLYHDLVYFNLNCKQ